MSIRKLPEIQNFVVPEGMESAPSVDAVERWQPALRIKNDAAGGGGVTTIEILDKLGKDPYFGTGVDSNDVARALNGAKDVCVVINSPGGNFFEGTAIYNLLRAHAGKVTVKVIGLAASATSIVAMAADELLMSPASFLMIHNGWTVTVGDRHDMQNAADFLSSVDSAIRDVYVARTGKHAASVASMMDDETWMNAKDAIAGGFADGMVERSAVTEDPKAKAAAHPHHARAKADSIFAHQGLTRSKRRELMAELKGAPPAPAADTSGGLSDLCSDLKNFSSELKGSSGDSSGTPRAADQTTQDAGLSAVAGDLRGFLRTAA